MEEWTWTGSLTFKWRGPRANGPREICTKVFSRLGMITKLKYVGVGMEDLIDIFKLFIRNVSEYCSVLFHSRLTVEDSNKLERIQNLS